MKEPIPVTFYFRDAPKVGEVLLPWDDYMTEEFFLTHVLAPSFKKNDDGDNVELIGFSWISNSGVLPING